MFFFRRRKKTTHPPMPNWMKLGLAAFVLYAFYQARTNPEFNQMQWKLPKLEDYQQVLQGVPSGQTWQELEGPYPHSKPAP